MLKYPLGCQIESEEISLVKFWHMGDVMRSKGGRQHLGLLNKNKFPFLKNMPRLIYVFLFKLVPGVQYLLVFRRAEEGENWHLLQVGNYLEAKKELFVQGRSLLGCAPVESARESLPSQSN